MPRLSLKFLLLVVSVVAVWLSTYTQYPAGRDVRAVICLVILIGSGLAVFVYDGRKRVFWLGFFGSMLAIGLGYPKEFVPNFFWIQRKPDGPGIYPLYFFNRDSIHLLANAAVSTLVGYVGCLIYDNARNENES